MGYLELSGASLYYETVGSGPLLLCISGANGSADLWRITAEHLRKHFTVAMYDRRGFSRSYLSGSQDYEHRIETDADDARQLIQHLSPDEPATVLGNSSGAMVSLELLTRHPEVIRVLIAHEPPAMKLLPDFDELWNLQQAIYDTYRRSGVPPAMQQFADMVKAGTETSGMLAGFTSRKSDIIANTMYWFERELLVYPCREVQVAILETRKASLLLVNGSGSNKEALQYRANVVLAQKIGLEVGHVPGMHLGFASHPKGFANAVLDCLKEKDSFYATL